MGEWKRVDGTPAFDTLADWLREEARDGQKFESVMFAVGNSMRGVIVWSDGIKQEIIVGLDEAGVRVLRRRDLS